MNSIQKKREIPEWWADVPTEEREVLCEVMRMVRGLKRSRVPQVARAARAWECGLGCFIRVKLMSRSSARRGTGSVRPPISCRSASRNPPGVSPDPS
jgi:hypothetical protein